MPESLRELDLDPPRPNAIDRVADLVEDDLEATERTLADLLQSTITIIPEVGGHLAFAGGKRFRPLVTLLAARAAGFAGSERIVIAAVGELLHTATLLHDDVIDGGEFRRGRPAARLRYGNGMAVLVGDFCFARALSAIGSIGRIEAVSAMGRAVTRMAEGEVAQLHAAGDFCLDAQRYYMVVDRKTAALIAWCSSLAGLVGPALADPLERYGLELGYAFQIADDVIDYAHGLDVAGKTRGQDLHDGKMTLPLILACERDVELRARVHDLLEAGAPVRPDAVHTVVERVARSGALERARAIATQHAEAAAAALAAVPAGEATTALADLAAFVVARVY